MSNNNLNEDKDQTTFILLDKLSYTFLILIIIFLFAAVITLFFIKREIRKTYTIIQNQQEIIKDMKSYKDKNNYSINRK